MKQYILMNNSGDAITIGLKMQFFDKFEEDKKEIASLKPDENGASYSLRIQTDDDFDMWAIYSGSEEPENDTSGPWLLIQKYMVDEKCEVIGEL